MVKDLPAKFDPLGQKIPPDKEMTTHSSILAWEIPWTEEPGGLQLMGWQRVGHDLVTEYQVINNIYVISRRRTWK